MNKTSWDFVFKIMYAGGNGLVALLWAAFAYVLIYMYIDIPLWMIASSLVIIWVGNTAYSYRKYEKVIK